MKAGLPKLLNSFVRHTAVSFTSCRPVSKIGDQGMSARDEIFVSWGFNESSRKAHGATKCTGWPLKHRVLLYHADGAWCITANLDDRMSALGQKQTFSDV